MARIIIVDDHHIFRDGIGSLIKESEQDELVGSLPDFDGLDALIISGKAECVLLDLSLQDGMSFDGISRLKAKHSDLKVIILSMHGDQENVERAMRAGADGYALKQDAFDDLLFAIRAAERGGRFISPTIISQGDVSIKMEKPSVDEMPERQRQILSLLAQGLSNKQIASEIGIALPTVKNHLSVLFRKYGVSNRVGLLAKMEMINPNDV